MGRLRARARGGGPRAIFSILVGLGSAAVIPAAHAEGIPFGKWSFYPSVDAVWQNESNLFLSQDDPVSASSYALRPRLRWELPFRDSLVRFVYSPQVREFFGPDGEDEQGLDGRYYSHFIELGTKLGFSNQTKVDFRGELTIDTFETTGFDAGGEVVFNDNEYRKDHIELEAIRPLGARHGVGLHGAYDRLDFDEDASVVFLDYDRVGGGLIYAYKLSPLSQVRVSLGLEGGTQDRPPGVLAKEKQGYERREARVLWQSAIGRSSTVEARVGFMRWDFEDSSEDFAGLTGDVRYGLQLGSRTRVSAVLARNALPSFFNVNSYYVTSFAEARVQRERPGSRLTYFVLGSYRMSDYPERLTDSMLVVIGPRREDRTARAEVGVGYKFNQLFQGEARYSRVQRHSNLSGFDYDSDRVLVQLSLGWY